MRRIMTLAIALIAGFGFSMSEVRADHIVVATPNDFIQALGDEAMRVLQDPQSTREERERRFLALYRSHFDGRDIAQAIVGRPWQSATTSERNGLNGLADEYITRKLVFHLWAFRGATFKAPWFGADGGKIIVISEASQPETRKHLNIKWILRPEGRAWKIYDVYIEGFSLRLMEQREFKSLFHRFGGTVAGLMRAFSEEIAKISRLELRG